MFHSQVEQVIGRKVSCPAFQANFGGAHRTLPVNLHTPYYPDEEPRERI